MSTDGWLVTPREIASAFECYFMNCPGPITDPEIGTLFTFLTNAMLRGGFVVW